MNFKLIKPMVFIVFWLIVRTPLAQSKSLFNYNNPLNIELELNLSKLLLKDKSYYWQEGECNVNEM